MEARCAFPGDGPCYFRLPAGGCGRGREACLRPWREGTARSDDVRLLAEVAKDMMRTDPDRAAAVGRVAARLHSFHQCG